MTMKKSVEILLAGHACLDLAPRFDGSGGRVEIPEVFVPGRLTNVGGMSVSLGGAVPNTGLTLVQLGIAAGLAAKVGDDPFGEILRGLLGQYGADGSVVVSKDTSTSYSVVLLLPGSDRIFLHHTGANDTFSAADVDYAAAGEARLFHFGYPPLMRRMFEDDGTELLEIFRRVHAAGTATSLDMAMPDPAAPSGKADWRRILTAVLPHVDVFVPSFEETAFMLDRPAFDRLRREAAGRDLIECMDIGSLHGMGDVLLAMGAGIVVIKCGVRGYYVRTGSGERVSRIPKLHLDPGEWADREFIAEAVDGGQVVSTSGAGDSSIGGFLAALLRGLSPENAANLACSVAAYSVSTVDAYSGIPRFDEVLTFSRSGPKRLRFMAEGRGWRFDSRRQVWLDRRDAGARGMIADRSGGFSGD